MKNSVRLDSVCTNTCITKDGLDTYEDLETFIQKSTKNKLIVSFISNSEIEKHTANIDDTVSCFVLHSPEIQLDISHVLIELNITFTNGNTKTITSNNINTTISSGIIRGSYVIVEDDLKNGGVLENAQISASVIITNRNEVLQSEVIDLVV